MSLTCDGWTSDAQQHFVALTAHFIDSKWELRSMCLGLALAEAKQTAAQVSHNLEAILVDVGMANTHVVSVTRDNGANFVAGVTDFLIGRTPSTSVFAPLEIYASEASISCFAHSLQLAVLHSIEDSETTDNLKDTTTLCALFKTMHELVTLFRTTPALGRQLAEAAAEEGLNRTKLQQSVPTRWSSTFHMVESILHMKTALLRVRKSTREMYSAEMDEYNDRPPTARAKKTPERPALLDLCPHSSSEDWVILNQAVEVLRSVASIINDAEGEYYPTLSLACLATRIVLHQLKLPIRLPAGEVELACVTNLRANLRVMMWHYIGPIMRSNLCLLACVLDPRVKPYMDADDLLTSKLAFTADERDRAYQTLEVYTQFAATRAAGDGESGEQPKPDVMSVDDEDTSGAGRAQLHHAAHNDMAAFLLQELESIKHSSADSSLRASTAAISSEVAQYKALCTAEDIGRGPYKLGLTASPESKTILDWWRDKSVIFPYVGAVARLAHAVTATSAASERVFSATSRVNGRLRAAMSAPVAQAIVREHEMARGRVVTTMQPTH